MIQHKMKWFYYITNAFLQFICSIVLKNHELMGYAGTTMPSHLGGVVFLPIFPGNCGICTDTNFGPVAPIETIFQDSHDLKESAR